MTEIHIRDDMHDMEIGLRAYDINKTVFFKAAEISPETWYRWRRGDEPTVRLWNRVYRTYRDLIAEANGE